MEHAHSHIDFSERLGKAMAKGDPTLAFHGAHCLPDVTQLSNEKTEDSEMARQRFQGLNPHVIEVVRILDAVPEVLRS